MESDDAIQMHDKVLRILEANLQLLIPYLSRCIDTKARITDTKAKEFKFIETIARAEAALLELLSEEHQKLVLRQHLSQNVREHQVLETLGPNLGLRKLRESKTADVNPGGPSYAIGVNVKVVYCCANSTASTLAIELQGWGCADNINAPDCPPIA